MASAPNGGCLAAVVQDGRLCSFHEDPEDRMPLSSLLCGERQRLPATPMCRKLQDGAVRTSLEALLPDSSRPSWERAKQ
eukprot:6103093-Amphidinium_carterae.1